MGRRWGSKFQVKPVFDFGTLFWETTSQVIYKDTTETMTTVSYDIEKMIKKVRVTND